MPESLPAVDIATWIAIAGGEIIEEEGAEDMD